MPYLTFDDEQHKARALQSMGYDPNMYDVDEQTGNVNFRIKTQPTVTTGNPLPEIDTTPKPPEISTMGAVGLGIGSGIAPTLTGAGGAALLGRLGAAAGTPLGPIGQGIGGIIGAGAGAIGGASLAEKIQQMVMPHGVEDQLAAAQAQHPIAFPAGRFAANLLAFKPGLKELGEAAKTGGNLLSRLLPGVGAEAPITSGQMQNLINIGAGVGLGAGQPIAEGLIKGEPINTKEALLGAAGGALLNRPTKLAQKLFKFEPADFGVKPLEKAKEAGIESSTMEPKESLADYQTRITEEARKKEEAAKNPTIKKSIEQQLSPERETPFYSEREKRMKIIIDGQTHEETGGYKIPRKQFINDLQEHLSELIDSGQIKESTGEDKIREMLDRKVYGDEAVDKFLGEQEKTRYEAATARRQAAEEKMSEHQFNEQIKQQQAEGKTQDLIKRRESNYQQYKNLMRAGKLAEASKFIGDLPGEALNFNKRYSAEKAAPPGEVEKPFTEVSPIDLEKARQERKKFQEGEEPGLEYEAAKKLKQTAAAAGTTGKIRATKGFFDIMKSVFGKHRGVKLTLDNKLVDDSGAPAKGAIDSMREGFKDRLSKINPELATPDTIPHEFMHGFMGDLRNSPNKRDRDFAAKLENAVKNTQDYKTENTKRGGKLNPEEYLATTGGIESFNRLVNLDRQGGTNKQAWKDFIARVKFKWGNASAEHLNKILADRFLTDPSFIETHVKPNVGVVTGTEEEINKKSQTEPPAEETIKNPVFSEEGQISNKGGENLTNENRQKETENLAESGNKEKDILTESSSKNLQEPSKEANVDKAPGENASDKPPISPDKKETPVISKEGQKFQEGDEPGLEKSEPSNIEKLQKDALDTLKENLKERIIYQNIKVISHSDTRQLSPRYSGVYYPETKEIKSRPNDLETALHEAVHHVNDINMETFNKLLDNAKFTPEELWNSAIAIGGEGYRNHERNLNLLAGNINQTPNYRDKLNLFKAFDEISAQFADKKSPPVRQTIFRNFVAKVAGNEYADFLEKGSRAEEYFPKFKDPWKETVNVLADRKSKLRSQIEDLKDLRNNGKISSEELKNHEKPLYEKLDKIRDQIDSINKKYPGEYYQSGDAAGLTPDDIKRNISHATTSPEFKRENVFIRAIKEFPFRLPGVGSEMEKLPLRAGEAGKKVAPYLKEFYDQNRIQEGKYRNPALAMWANLKSDDAVDLYSKLLAEQRTGKTQEENLNPEQQLVYNQYRELLKQKQQEQIDAKQPVEVYVKGERGGFNIIKRMPKINPYYMHQIVGSARLDTLLNYRDTPQFERLKSDFVSHQMKSYKMDNEEATKLFDDLLASYGGPIGGDSTRFGAVRRAEGVGLPDSWLEPNPVVAVGRYWRRVAKDRAWFDSVETDHDALKILGYNKDPASLSKNAPVKSDYASLRGNETLENILDIINGENIKTNPRLDALSRIANNLIFGPITGITDLVSAVPALAKFIPSPANVPAVIGAMWNLGKGIEHARATGGIKERMSDMEDYIFPRADLAERLRSIGDGISKYTGRQDLENVARGLSQIVGEKIIDIHRGLAENGNKKSATLLEELANTKDWKDLSTPELSARLMQLTQGTYDIRGLPAWSINSQLAPFVRMAKWNIEQLNNLHKYAMVPLFRDGNPTPLIMTLVGGTLGGYIAKEVREKLTGKKGQTPEWREILGNKDAKTIDKLDAATYNLAGAWAYSGVLGTMGELFKSGMDLKYKNKPQGFNYPLAETIGDVSVNVAQAINAISEGENPISVLTELNKQIFLQNIQVGRLGYNWYNLANNKEQVEDTSQRRDLRIYKSMSGLPIAPQGGTEDNPYIGLEGKGFKNISDIKEMVAEAPKMIKQAIVDAHGDPDLLKRKLSGLKRDTVNTLPSPDSAPYEFAKYYNYLKNTFGSSEAQKRILSYGKERALNQARSSLIPSL